MTQYTDALLSKVFAHALNPDVMLVTGTEEQYINSSEADEADHSAENPGVSHSAVTSVHVVNDTSIGQKSTKGIRRQPSMKHQCKICDKFFYAPSHLKNHMCMHTGELCAQKVLSIAEIKECGTVRKFGQSDG